MDKWVGKVALVTGASVGIGEATVEKLVEQGVKVVGIARRKEKLAELEKKHASKKGKFYGFQGDLTKEEDILNAFKWTKENVGPVSILVNNAAILPSGPLSSTPTKDWRYLLDLNVLALSIATREAITQMKANNIDGQIFHLNSVAGHKILNLEVIAFYTATKYAVTALAEALRLELGRNGSKTKITSISPGAVATEMRDTTLAKMAPEVQAEAKKSPSLDPADVANAIIFVLSTPKHVQIPELTIQAVGDMS